MNRLLWILVLIPGLVFGGEWLQWRGPDLNGTTAAENLPDSWSMETGENIAWSCTLQGTGQSTPIVTGSRIFLTSSDNHQLYAVCIDRKTGQVAWQRKAGTGRDAMRRGNMAHPSAVSDGERVYFLFGQGTLVAFTLDGKELWRRELENERGRLANKFGYSSSPLLYNQKLYIPLLHWPDAKVEDSKPGTTLMAVDPASGKTLWAADRPTPASHESYDSYITPIVGKTGIILTGADLVTSHDPEDGSVQWAFDVAKGDRKTNWRIISGPVQAGDLTVTAYPRGGTLVALKPDGSKRWSYEGHVPDVCTPAYHDGLLYMLDGSKRYLTCIHAQTGREEWQVKVVSDQGFFASPLVADGKIYLLSLSGDVLVYAIGKPAKLLNRIPMEASHSAASIIAVDNELYIRLPDRLICIRNQK